MLFTNPVECKKLLFFSFSVIVALLISFGHYLNLSYENPVADQRQYLAYAYNTLKHGVYDDTSNDSPSPDYRREPAYPLTLMIAMLFHPGIELSTQAGKCITLGEGKCIKKVTCLKIANIILLTATALLSGYVVFVFNKSVLASSICFLLIALSASLGRYTSRFFPETLAAFLIVAVSYSLYNLVQKEYSHRRAFLFGLLLAALVLTKAIFYYFILPCSLLLFVWWMFKGIGIKNSSKRLSSFVFGAILLVAPWTVRNYIQLGTFSVAGRSGLMLTMRANYDEMSSEEYFVFILHCASNIKAVKKRIKDHVDPNIYEKVSGPKYKDDAYSRMRQVKDELGMRYPEANNFLVNEAENRILRNFGNHVAMTLPFALRGSFPEEGYGFNPKNARHGTIGIKKFGMDVTKYFISAKVLPNITFIAAFFGTFIISLILRKWGMLWFLLPSIYGFGMYAFFTIFISRYSISFIPIFVICVCIAGSKAFSLVNKLFWVSLIKGKK